MAFTIVGDADQCVLEGEMVNTVGSVTPIEYIRKYDFVLAATGQGKFARRAVLGTSSDTKKVVVVELETESGKKMRVTHNHLCFASFPNRNQSTRMSDIQYIYLMYKKNYGFRIGTTKNPRNRLASEGADRLWLVKSCAEPADVFYYENLLSVRYGIPTMTFVDHMTQGKESKMNQHYIDRLFTELDTESSAMRMAVAEGMLFDRCAHIVARNHKERIAVYVTMCATLNTKTPMHKISLETSYQPAIDAMLDANIPLHKAKVGMRFRMTSASIREIQKMTDLIEKTIDCQVVVRTNFISKKDMDNRYSLNPQMMPAGNILPGFMVPIYNDNKVVLDKVVQVNKSESVETVYDLEVAEVANYFVNGICVHNTLYRFAGARPQANLEGIEGVFPDIVTKKLTVNWRSTKAIVGAQLALIKHNYEVGGGPYENRFFKELRPGPNAEDGEKVSFVSCPDPLSEARLVVETIVEGMSEGRKPGDYFVGARTRAQLGHLEGPLVRAKIPFINIAGGSFWASKHVADIVAYASLSNDEGDQASFKRVYNVASNENVYQWGEDEGEYCPHRYLGAAFLQAAGNSMRGMERAAQKRRSWASGVEDLREFMWKLEDETKEIEGSDGKPGDLIRFIVNQCYLKYLQAQFGLTGTDAAVNGKVEDMETVADIADEFESISEFLDHVRSCVQAAEDAKEKKWDEYVVLSTVHRLKGLERPVVIGIGTSEGFDKRSGEPRGLLPHTFSMVTPPQFGVLPTGGKAKMEDERCIGFVLVSRAQEQCFLFGTETYRNSEMYESRFVVEMGDWVERGE